VKRIINVGMSLFNYKTVLCFGLATLLMASCNNNEAQSSISNTVPSYKQENQNELVSTTNTVQKQAVANAPIEKNEVLASENVIDTSPKLLISSSEEYTEPCYCRSGDLFFLGKGGSELFYLEKGQKTPVSLAKSGRFSNNVAWSKNCNEIYYKEKNKDYSTTIKSINVNTKKVTSYPHLPALTQLKSLSYSDTAYFLDKKSLDIKAKYKDNEWLVIKNEEQGFYMTLISPDGKYIATHQGSRIELYGINGEYIRKIGNGIATDWSPDSKYLIGFEEEASNQHHEIGNADIYLYDISNGLKKPITQTTDALESWPSFKSKNEIVYTDMKNKGVFTKKIVNQ